MRLLKTLGVLLGVGLVLAISPARDCAAAVVSIVENFDLAEESGLHSALEDANSAFTFVDDNAKPTGGRNYIRTLATDYNTEDWIAEITYTLPSGGGGANTGYFGLGGADPDGAEWGEPTPALYLQVDPSSGQIRVEYDPGPGSNDFIKTTLGTPGFGTHRLRIEKEEDVLTYAYDADYIGGPFSADASAVFSFVTDAPALNGTNSRIFFGSQSASPSTTFDDLSINVIPEPSTLLLLGSGLLLLWPRVSRRRRS
ncbi:MAG: PEP-CTERM sorting domain-containing protein [bacterium]|nr:PEP-CTERM sorting domain-containing protein [bacterium]